MKHLAKSRGQWSTSGRTTSQTRFAPTGATQTHCRGNSQLSCRTIQRKWLRTMDGNEWLVTFHQSLIFPVSRWVRSVLICLAEGGDCVPSDLKAELLHTVGISGTDIIENSFKWLREKARRDKAEKQSPMTQWQRTMASPFMEASDKRPLQLSAESDTLAPHTVSPDIFIATKCKCSLGDKLLSRFLEL